MQFFQFIFRVRGVDWNTNATMGDLCELAKPMRIKQILQMTSHKVKNNDWDKIRLKSVKGKKKILY